MPITCHNNNRIIYRDYRGGVRYGYHPDKKFGGETASDELRLVFVTLRNVPEDRKLTNCPIGINVGCRHYFISSAAWEAAFPLPDFPITDYFRYPAFLLTRGSKVMQMLVTGEVSAVTEILYHVGIHKSYPVVRTSDNDSVCHSVNDTQ